MADQDPQRAWVQNLGLFAVVVTTVVSYTGGGMGLGYVAWKYLGLPVWTIVPLALVGLSVAMYRVYQVSQRL